MKKLILTESQYTSLFNTIAEEAKFTSRLLNESSKDVLLCIGNILKSSTGQKLSNYNKVFADKLVKDPVIMGKVKETFEDVNKLDELIDEFKNVGMNNPHIRLAKNANEIVNEFNKIASDNNINLKLDVDVINNLRALDKNISK